MPHDPFAGFRSQRRFDRALRTVVLAAAATLVGTIAGAAGVFAVVGVLMPPHADQRADAVRSREPGRRPLVTTAAQTLAPVPDTMAAAAGQTLLPAGLSDSGRSAPPFGARRPAASAPNTNARAATAAKQIARWDDRALENAQATRVGARPAKPLYGYAARWRHHQYDGRSPDGRALSRTRPTYPPRLRQPGFAAEQERAESFIGHDQWVGDWHR
ncbi:MAG: hypothetical protein KGQ47_12940 [Hyphomicrobiales bacterium]|nr:hypothetical protein [Hyphomicrobiales bacterium]